MFVTLRDVSAAKKVIATLLATAMVLWASGAFNTVQAASITDAYQLVTDSAPSASSTHTIEFVTPSGVATGGETIIVDFNTSGFDLSSIVEADIDLEINGTDVDISGTAWSVVVGATDITFTSVAGSAPAGATTTIVIGLAANFGGAGTHEIVNPVPTGGNESFEIFISAGASDSGNTRVVILDTVLVTASVATTFNFTVSGLATSSVVSGTTTTKSSSSTTIPFGELTAGEQEVIGQRLQVSTNAANGYVVTVEADGAFESSTGADIDVFDDGVLSTTPATWSPPGNILGTEDSYGHWGVASADTSANRGADEFGAGEYVGLSTTPVNVMWHDGPTNDIAASGSTTVSYSVEIEALQEAGDDYETVLTYIATPTF